jgi:hypothetical protein
MRPCSRQTSQKYAERSLCGAIPDKADQDARGELRRCEPERHQQDREHDRHDRHDRGCNAAEDHLGHARIFVRREKRTRDPGSYPGNRFFQRREHRARCPQDHGDDQRPNEESAAETRTSPNATGQASAQSFGCPMSSINIGRFAHAGCRDHHCGLVVLSLKGRPAPILNFLYRSAVFRSSAESGRMLQPTSVLVHQRRFAPSPTNVCIAAYAVFIT